MKSHSYEPVLSYVLRRLALAGLSLFIFAVLIRLAVRVGLLPDPWPAWDLEHSVITQQVQSSLRGEPADLVCIGDSSCLMDVSGAALSEATGGRFTSLNLGSFSYLGFTGFNALLTRYSASTAKPPNIVLFLVHPQMLRNPQPVPEYLVLLSDRYANADYEGPPTLMNRIQVALGLHIIRNRVLGRLPVALPGAYGDYYGFTLNLMRHMDLNKGSAVDPNVYVSREGQGVPEYRLGESLEAVSQSLRAAVPPGVKVAVALAPIPESFAPVGHGINRDAMLRQWGEWMGADFVLTNLPPTMDDSMFASTTHLNEKGAKRFSSLVASWAETVLESR